MTAEVLQTLQRFLQLRPDLSVIVLSKVGDSRQVVEAIRIGAHDYITLPLREFELLQLLKRHVNNEWEADSHTKESVEEVGGDDFFLSDKSAHAEGSPTGALPKPFMEPVLAPAFHESSAAVSGRQSK